MPLSFRFLHVECINARHLLLSWLELAILVQRNFMPATRHPIRNVTWSLGRAYLKLVKKTPLDRTADLNLFSYSPNENIQRHNQASIQTRERVLTRASKLYEKVRILHLDCLGVSMSIFSTAAEFCWLPAMLTSIGASPPVSACRAWSAYRIHFDKVYVQKTIALTEQQEGRPFQTWWEFISYGHSIKFPFSHK